MNIDTNSDDCIEWLKSTLMILKSGQVDSNFQNKNLSKVSAELIDVLYKRDIDATKLIFQQHITSSTSKDSNAKDLILPPSMQLKKNGLQEEKTLAKLS